MTADLEVQPRFPMNARQKKAIAALGRCSFLPGSFDKRFAGGVNACVDDGLTSRQYECLKKMLFRYRRQIWGKSVKDEYCRLQIEAKFPPLPKESP